LGRIESQINIEFKVIVFERFRKNFFKERINFLWEVMFYLNLSTGHECEGFG
jgi:hypothetical protein